MANLNNPNDLTKILQQQSIDGLRAMIRLAAVPIVIGDNHLQINYIYAGTPKTLDFKTQGEAAKWLCDNGFVDEYEEFNNGVGFVEYRTDYIEIEGRGWIEKPSYTAYNWSDLQSRVAFDREFMKLPDVLNAVVLHEMQAYSDLSKNHAMQIFDALFSNLKNNRA